MLARPATPDLRPPTPNPPPPVTRAGDRVRALPWRMTGFAGECRQGPGAGGGS